MAPAVWLIAEREFRTYVATASFWIALAIGPLSAMGALAIASGHPPKPSISIHANDPGLVPAAARAAIEAGRLEGHEIILRPTGERMDLSRSGGRISIHFGSAFPLSREGRAFVMRTLELDLARGATAGSTPSVKEAAAPVSHAHESSVVLPGFVLMMLLWLTLTGSLGMLLQSVVRERANRSLETLLAAAAPWQIMFGKLAGVGAISFCVLGAWLGSTAIFAIFFPAGNGPVAGVLSSLAMPATLGRAVLIYTLGYAFYGSLTIAVGAMARDTATAQNLSRPVFVVLLAAFFLALWSTATGQAALLSWLVYVPPFAPFLLLLAVPATQPLHVQIVSLALLLISVPAAASLAINRLSIAPAPWRPFKRK